MKVKRIFFFMQTLLLLVGCAPAYLQFIPAYHFRSADGKPDYRNPDYWAAGPFKKNPSDSLPDKLQKGFLKDTAADIFYIYPTTYTDRTLPFGLNAPIDNAALNAKTDYVAVLNQASIFNAAGRVFAPRYRQASYWCYFPKDSADSAADRRAFALAYQDVKTAFEYYLKHFNHGRPIIIASHSQGTTHAKLLLKDFFDGKPLQQQLVAAYLVGMPVEPDYFSSIPPCASPDQTGCFCSWRTMRQGYLTSFVKKETFTAVVTNPITWKASDPVAGRFQNLGSVLYNFKKISRHVVGAQVHQGVLWVRRPRFFGNLFYFSRNYHVGDFNFFYMDVRKNAEDRVKSFLTRQTGPRLENTAGNKK